MASITYTHSPESLSRAGNAASIRHPESQSQHTERESFAWAFTWGILTGWELPNVPDWPALPSIHASAKDGASGADGAGRKEGARRARG